MIEHDTYKDSGIEWLGEIPEHWGLIRLKDLGLLQNGISKSKEYFGKGFPFLGYGNIYNDKIELKDIKGLANSTIEDQKNYSVVEGDVFFTRTSETIDEIGIASTCLQTIKTATFSGFSIRLRPNKNKINKHFSNFYFKANINRIFLSSKMSSVTRASLSQNVLNNLPTILPPLPEQTIIANYLDKKTKAIDQKTNLLTKKAEKYKELRKSLINQTVTKGLDKTVKLKDSGIDWIGDIPVHWEVKRLKDLTIISTGSKNSEDYDNDGIYPFFVRSPNIKKINTFSYEGEAVLTAGDGDIGKIFHYINGKFDVHQRVYCISDFNNKLNAKYFYYYLSSKLYNQAMINNSNSIVNSLRLPLFRNFEIIISSTKEEQTAIANYLDEKTGKIDAIVNNIGNQINHLKELRKTLINDVVTGKIKVGN
jgi:type I restriction enzyme S subunit